MKQEFSTSWIGSAQVRKQRKYRYNSPLHIKQKFLAANLSKDLRKKYGRRSAQVKKGDEVLVMRGSFAKKKAKVISVDLKKTRVTLENITRTKKDGTKIPVFFRPNVLQIIVLNNDDKKRFKKAEMKEKNNAPNKSSN